MKYEILAIDFIGSILTVIGFSFMLRTPSQVIEEINQYNELRVRPNKNFIEDYKTHQNGIIISFFGFVLQGIAIWAQIAFT